MKREVQLGTVRSAAGELRFLTYLSPGLPVEIFEAVASRAGAHLGLPTSVAVESSSSGPAGAERDPFSTGKTDVGFMCAPPYIWLRDREDPPVELLGVVPVFEDQRAAGDPVYFSDVIVRRESPFLTLEDLRGGVIAYNDACSLSGYYCLLQEFERTNAHKDEPAVMLHSGSHLRSMDLVTEGRADAAAVDSNVLALRLAAEPALRGRIRVVESLGPYPIQPVVVRSDLEQWLKIALRDCISSWPNTARGREELSTLGLIGFAPVDETHYEPERAALAACAKR
jgi:phosphonate transport system substrate-binding protein